MHETKETWFFSYDSDTYEYAGAVKAAECPDNATDIEPTGLIGPIFNIENEKWEGKTIADEMAKLAKSAKMSIDPDKQMLSSMMATMMKQEMRIQQLEAEQSGGAK
ncbi:hypothetical protein ACT5YR_07450 [Fructobacillus fructosus]|uniref:hypothetical protein n=1 Tax=Fructobacillus fructosus TaxID=1631 RepID=UPI004033E6DA